MRVLGQRPPHGLTGLSRVVVYDRELPHALNVFGLPNAYEREGQVNLTRGCGNPTPRGHGQFRSAVLR